MINLAFSHIRSHLFQANGTSEVFVAGDPERKHMALCDRLGGIPYKQKQIQFAVQFNLVLGFGFFFRFFLVMSVV